MNMTMAVGESSDANQLAGQKTVWTRVNEGLYRVGVNRVQPRTWPRLWEKAKHSHHFDVSKKFVAPGGLTELSVFNSVSC